MELDYKTIKALSSPTRIKILSSSLEAEATTTSLSQDLEKSKSTVSSHLEKLVSSGLLEKDAEEGRRRVVYRPTDKAKAVVQGRSRKVKFSVTSSFVSAIIGLSLLASEASSLGPEDNADLMMEAEESVSQEPSIAFLFLAGFFLLLSISTLAYGLTLRKISS